MIAACIVTFILACAFAADDSALHRLLIIVSWLVMMFALAFPVKAQPSAPKVIEAEHVEPIIVGQSFDTLSNPSPSAYVPPPTPQPIGRPTEVHCWLTRWSVTVPINAPPVIWCCYEWRANQLDQRWVFLQCVK